MGLVSLCVLAHIVALGLCDPINNVVTPSVETNFSVDKQIDHMLLYFHAREPNHVPKCKSISSTWNIEDNIKHFKNATAVNLWIELKKNSWLLPISVPFFVQDVRHQFEAVTLFNVLYSAKDKDTYYKTAAYLKDRVNQDLFIYVLNAVDIHRFDMKGFAVPPIYEVLPEYFNNGEILTTAQRIGVHGDLMIEHFPSTFKWDYSIVIKWNETIWPYYGQSTPISYFINDYGLNSYYYYYHLTYPNWIGGSVIPFTIERRGEWCWFMHKQIVSRYYMERLSNGLGEINDLSNNLVEEGYNNGYIYHNGIPYPVRPNNFHLDQPKYLSEIEKIKDYERRIRDAIESGFIINSAGEHVDIRSAEAIDILGRVIEASIDSPNVNYYKDFINSWKSLLGNSLFREHDYQNLMPLVVPAAIEHYQTALSDPAFYMVWKRALNLFTLWQRQLPFYEKVDLAIPDIAIEKVEVDRMVTYFEYTYMNISAFIHMDEDSSKFVFDKKSVLVQYPRLNHKKFIVRVHVKSEVAKKVEVRFFLAPKYDSHGLEIPLDMNSENFFLLDIFNYDIPAGESVIVRDSTKNALTVEDLRSASDNYIDALQARKNKKEFMKAQGQNINYFPHRLLLPKGRVGGMPFVLVVYIYNERPPIVPYSANYTSGSGFEGRRLSNLSLGFPFDRPLYPWQVQNLQNIFIQDVLIHHKQTPEIGVPYSI